MYFMLTSVAGETPPGSTQELTTAYIFETSVKFTLGFKSYMPTDA